VIAELDTNVAVSDMVDIVLYDCFAQPESDHDEISVLVRSPRAGRVAVYTWNFHPDLMDSAVGRASTGTCQRRYRRATWSLPWKRSMPATS
jgi:hypothetical protein